MKVAKFLRWFIRIVLFLLILVLIINNMSIVEFNLLGIYKLHLPLIALALLILGIGIIIGLLINIPHRIEQKGRINQLEKELHNKTQIITSKSDTI